MSTQKLQPPRDVDRAIRELYDHVNSLKNSVNRYEVDNASGTDGKAGDVRAVKAPDGSMRVQVRGEQAWVTSGKGLFGEIEQDRSAGVGITIAPIGSSVGAPLLSITAGQVGTYPVLTLDASIVASDVVAPKWLFQVYSDHTQATSAMNNVAPALIEYCSGSYAAQTKVNTFYVHRAGIKFIRVFCQLKMNWDGESMDVPNVALTVNGSLTAYGGIAQSVAWTPTSAQVNVSGLADGTLYPISVGLMNGNPDMGPALYMRYVTIVASSV